MNGISETPPGVSDVMIPPEFYRAGPKIRDEATSAGGKVVPAWAEIFESYRRHGVGVLKEWREAALRISRDRGLAYRPDRGDGAQWTLDPIPWVFSPECLRA